MKNIIGEFLQNAIILSPKKIEIGKAKIENLGKKYSKGII